MESSGRTKLDIGIFITLAIYLVGLIWGAATLKAGVAAQREILLDVKASVNGMSHRVNQVEIHNAYQDGQIDALKDRVPVRPQP